MEALVKGGLVAKHVVQMNAGLDDCLLVRGPLFARLQHEINEKKLAGVQVPVMAKAKAHSPALCIRRRLELSVHEVDDGRIPECRHCPLVRSFASDATLNGGQVRLCFRVEPLVRRPRGVGFRKEPVKNAPAQAYPGARELECAEVLDLRESSVEEEPRDVDSLGDAVIPAVGVED